ncbi:MAG: metalloregulator ArsR/SmtB family transcription factor [Patescibacteria group bacterium]
MHLNELAQLMRTAGDESRLRILCVLFRRKKVCVSDMAKTLHASVAITSHHLRVMSGEKLVVPVREGKKICYTLPKGVFVRDLKKFICKYK